MSSQNPLNALRDIHLPEQVSFWPLAPGWWILIFIAISLITFGVYRLYKNHQRKAIYRSALSAIEQAQSAFKEHQDQQLLLKSYSSLIRRIALAYYPRDEVAGLTGEQWLARINQLATEDCFSEADCQMLLYGPYQSQPMNLEQVQSLETPLRLWLNKLQQQVNLGGAK